MAIIPYDRITNLQNDQALHPTDPYPAQDMDAEYNAIKITTDDIIQHLDLIQRDDGQLENDSVGRDQLKDEVLIGFGAPLPWETGKDYLVGDTVFQDNAFWFCEVAHTSTTFIADHAAGYWSLIADFTDAATVGAHMYIGDTPPVTATHGQTWFESDTGNTYVFYEDPGGPPGQWVHTNGSSAADLNASGAVQYDTPQSLNATEQTQARRNIAAAPVDALAYSGMQVNGGMEVSQEYPTYTEVVFSGAYASKYIVDGWRGSCALTTGVVKLFRFDLPTEIPGLASAIQFQPSTVQASMGADYVRFETAIEGYRFSRAAWGTAAAIPVTVGFWFRAALSGTYRALMLNRVGSDSSGWVTFTITAGNFQWVTITFPGATTGTWDRANTIGASLIIDVSSSATPNIMASTANYASITGVVVLPGIEMPSAARAPMIMRPYDQELLTCQRYYEKTYIYSMAPGNAAGYYTSPGARGFLVYATNPYAMANWTFTVAKRIGPTVTAYSPYTGASGVGRSHPAAVDVPLSLEGWSDSYVTWVVNNTSIAAGGYLYVHATADARL
jgi:hypothetical protein